MLKRIGDVFITLLVISAVALAAMWVAFVIYMVSA